MKKIFIVLTLFVVSCQSFVQVYTVDSGNCTKSNSGFVYDNDSIRVTYDFWAPKGALRFEIYNKMDKPIYLDWKRSFFIFNEIKNNYWNDEVRTFSKSNYVFYTLPYVYNTTFGSQGTESYSKRDEQITIIPPDSKTIRFKFIIFPYKKMQFDPLAFVKEPSTYNPKKNIKIYREVYSENQSPYAFRNYLYISDNELFNKNFVVDNEFYISSISEMNSKNFRGKMLDKTYAENSKVVKVYDYPFVFGHSFFIDQIKNGAEKEFNKSRNSGFN